MAAAGPAAAAAARLDCRVASKRCWGPVSGIRGAGIWGGLVS